MAWRRRRGFDYAKIMIPLRLLLVEDSAQDADLILHELREAGFAPDWHRVDREADFIEGLTRDIDVILSDFRMPHFCGLRALKLLRERRPSVPFILISGTIGEDLAVEVMKQGAVDYLLKDRLGRLGAAIRQALEQSRSCQERHWAAKALRESEERFRQLAENIREVFWVTNPSKSKTIYVSPAYEAIWARPVAHLLESPWSWLEAVHPEDRGRVSQAVARQAERNYDEEYRIIRPDGEIRWIHDRAFPVRNAAGEVDRIVGVAGDITDRKRAEEIIRLSERRFASFMDNLPGLAWIKDAAGRYAYANKGCRELAMRDREWFEKTDDQIWPPEIAGKYRASDEKVIATKAPWQTVETVLQNGEERIALNSKFPIFDDLGEVAFVCGIGIDITERKRAEERNREQAELLDRAQDAIMVRDLKGRIRYWNRGAESVYGWTAAEAAGRLAEELLCTDLEKRDMAETALLEKGSWNGELRQVRKGGKPVIVSSRWTLLRNEAGEPRSTLVINSDITEHKQLEAQFLRAQRMESIGTLAGGIAHDLNNALGPIITALDLLRMRFPDPESQELLSILSSSAQHGADMVQQVLSFARGVEGRRMEVQVKHLILEIERIVNDTFLKHIQVRLDIAHDLGTVVGDPTQLHQVLLNLCVNARDAMPQGGILTLSAENLHLEANCAKQYPEAHPGSYICLQVEDTGTGMPPEVLEKIFDPFFTTKEIGKGTGLGLPTSLAIIKNHGGFMRVQSEPGNGTTFQVYIPTPSEAPLFAAAEIAAELPVGNGELILIVDDEAAISQITQQTLETFGYRAVLASDGAEAVSIFARQGAEIAAVLTDISMPVIDGATTIQILRQMKPEVRIIAASGLSVDSTLAVKHFLPKPYTAESLLNVVRQALTEVS
jgi:PAS domain S-box-containing protein